MTLWVTDDGLRPAGLPVEFDDESGLDLRFCSPGELADRLGEAVRSDGALAAVVLGASLDSPLRLARQVHRLAPFSHIVFLVEPERLTDFRSEMTLAPMIGTHWTIESPDPHDLLPALQSAARASRQQRHLRTSLDAINLRLRAEPPPPDSDEYRKLVISDKYLASILEHAPDAIVSLDPAGRIVSWNRGAEELFGYGHEAAVNMRLDQLTIAEKGTRLRGWFETAVAGSAVVQEEITFRRSSGEDFFAEVTFAPIRDDLGEVMAVALTARDVSARKRDEEELRRIRLELEERVVKRTAALRSVNRELEAFTYSASHDLRAPLRGIDGFSQALLEDYGAALDETAGRYIERIRAGAQRMGDIIDSLLLLSRISQSELTVTRVDLGQLARETVGELREREPDRRVDLRVTPGLVVQADHRLMRVAMENLLNNSWKFSRERDDAVIEVGRVEDRPRDTFFVRDNGAGFDMTYGEKLFVPFQRLHHPRRFEGTGIGLGTVQRVITRHGGRVWAQGEPGTGATFYFELPEVPASKPLADVERPA